MPRLFRASITLREEEYIKLKTSNRELKDDKHKTNSQKEQRIKQYKKEIRENKDESTQLQITIKELEDQIQGLVTSFRESTTNFD